MAITASHSNCIHFIAITGIQYVCVSACVRVSRFSVVMLGLANLSTGALLIMIGDM